MGRWGAYVVVFASGMVAGCGTPAFHCLGSEDCKDGTCEPNGFCSFPDEDCPSGSRYGEHAGAGLANACVEPQSAATDTGDDDDDDDDIVTDDAPDSGDEVGDTTGPPISPATTSTSSGSTSGPPVGGSGDDSGTTTGIMAGSSEGSSSDGSPPDIHVMSFGERSDADVQGVTEDTFLSFWDLGNNNGTHPDLHIASLDGDTPVEVSLTRFDLSALENVTVVSVDLTVSSYDAVSSGTVYLYRLNESWVEGPEDQSAGVCNWQLRDQDVLWLQAGAQGESHDPEAVGSFSLGQEFTDFNIDIEPETVQGWVDDPSTNHGLLFMSTEVPDAIWWASSEEFEESMRPLLVVRYLE